MNGLIKIKVRIPIILCMATLCYSCKQADHKAEAPPTFNATRILDHWHHPESLISLQNVAEIARVEPGLISVFSEGSGDETFKTAILFSWPTGGTVKVGGKHNIAEYHSLGLAFPERMTKEAFDEKYSGLEYLKKQVNDMTRDSLTEPDIAIAEAKYLAQYSKGREITRVQGVGDAAYWEMPLQALHIQVQGVAFTVTTNLGGEESENKRRAILLAQKIFDQD